MRLDRSARSARRRAGVADRVRSRSRRAKDFAAAFRPGVLLRCLHDMGDPVGAARHVRTH